MLGIDVSKDTLACTLFDPQTQKPIWNRTVPNTSSGINRLLRQTPIESHWALEPTGRYGLLAATTARQAGRQVLLAQPKRHATFFAPSRAAPRPMHSTVMASVFLPCAVRCRHIR